MARALLIACVLAGCGEVNLIPDARPDAPAMVTLTVTRSGDGSGTVTSSPTGVDCGSTCSMQVVVGTAVTLTAAADGSSTFSEWTGGGCSGTGDCVVTVTADTTVNAAFVANTGNVTLMVMKTGAGFGAVMSNDSMINCGTTCSATYPVGTMVTLTAPPGAASSFMGWSGAGCSGAGNCAITLTANTTVTANFLCNSGTQTINYSGAQTTFTVPACVTSLTIDAYGAQGGNSNGGTSAGGLGARMKGTFTVTGGQVLKVLVGGRGLDGVDTSQQNSGSGGGGTFVSTNTNTALIVAGGGGGAHHCTVGCSPVVNSPGTGGVITQAGTAGANNQMLGGTGGNGGTSSDWTGWHGGSGGGGFTGNGVNNTGGSSGYGTPNTPGISFVNGGAGGSPGSAAGSRAGGFGGGGASGFTGGGGGGYSGGGGGGFNNNNGGGGGGGSFNSGSNPTNVGATRSGHGVVIFTW